MSLYNSELRRKFFSRVAPLAFYERRVEGNIERPKLEFMKLLLRYHDNEAT